MAGGLRAQVQVGDYGPKRLKYFIFFSLSKAMAVPL